MNKILLVEKEIEKIILQSPHKTDPFHSKCTKTWLLKLKPDADDALQIAALAHDIERGFPSESECKPKERNIKEYNKHKEEHSKRSAKIIGDMLQKHDFDNSFIQKVVRLVLLHEVGGDEEADILKDADSLAFFEGNLEYYFSRHDTDTTIFQIKYKFDRMSQKAKSIAKEMKYSDTILNKLFQDTIS